MAKRHGSHKKKHHHKGKANKRVRDTEAYNEFFNNYVNLSKLVLETAADTDAVSLDVLAHIRVNHDTLKNSRPNKVLDFFISNTQDYYIAVADNLYDVVFCDGNNGPLWAPMRLKTVFMNTNEDTQLALWRQLNLVFFYGFSAKYGSKDCLQNALGRFYIGNSQQKKFVPRSNKLSESLVKVEETIDGLLPILEGTMIEYFTRRVPSEWNKDMLPISSRLAYIFLTIVSESYRGIIQFKGYPQVIEDLFDILVLEDHGPEAAEDDKLAKRIIEALPYEFKSPLKRLLRDIKTVNEGGAVKWNAQIETRVRDAVRGNVEIFDAVDLVLLDVNRESVRKVLEVVSSILVSMEIFSTPMHDEGLDEICNLVLELLDDDAVDDELDYTGFMKRVLDLAKDHMTESAREKTLPTIEKYMDAMSTEAGSGPEAEAEAEAEEEPKPDPQPRVAPFKVSDAKHIIEEVADESKMGEETKDALHDLEDIAEKAGIFPGEDSEPFSARKLFETSADTLKEKAPEYYKTAKELFDRLFLKLVSNRKLYRIVIDTVKPKESKVTETSDVSDISIKTLKDLEHLDINMWETVSDTVSAYENKEH